MDAQLVYERLSGGDLHTGPCEFVRVGMRINDRVFWTGAEHFPGSNGIQFSSDEALAKQVVDACVDNSSKRERALIRALERIRDAHVPDQPMGTAADETVWIMKHVSDLRRIATEALRENPT